MLLGMLGMVELLLGWLASLLKSRQRLQAENLVLRHQLNILRRRAPGRARLSNSDRLGFVWLYRLCPTVVDAVAIIRPETLIRWHRCGFSAFWRWKSRSKGGRPMVPLEVRELIREMSRANWLWGAPRIHGELLKLGIEVAQSTVAKYMVKRPRRPGQSWMAFLRNHADGIAAADLFVVPTIGFKLLYCLVILGHGRRKFIHYAVTAHPTAEWVARQIVEAFPWDAAPEYLVRDRDAVYGEVVRRRLRGLGIRDRPIAPRSPQQNAYVERLIGSVRRECIDHVIVFGESHLHRIMSMYARYYNQARTHLALGKDAPVSRSVEQFGRITTEPMVAGLHHRYSRI
jgi:transposase InsO family protein